MWSYSVTILINCEEPGVRARSNPIPLQARIKLREPKLSLLLLAKARVTTGSPPIARVDGYRLVAVDSVPKRMLRSSRANATCFLASGFRAPGHEYAASCIRPLLPRALNGHLPSEQEEAMTAKRAPVGLKKPLESPLHKISGVYASKVDGSAMRAVSEGEPYHGADHGSASAFVAMVAAGPARFGDGVE